MYLAAFFAKVAKVPESVAVKYCAAHFAHRAFLSRLSFDYLT